jgi:hypothetical protein
MLLYSIESLPRNFIRIVGPCIGCTPVKVWGLGFRVSGFILIVGPCIGCTPFRVWVRQPMEFGLCHWTVRL